LAARNNPARWLDNRVIYGELGDDPVFANAFSQSLRALWSEGTAAVLARYIG
jgi:mannitol 2-dehydrogenase